MMRPGWLLVSVSIALATWPLGNAPQDTFATDLLVLTAVLSTVLAMQVIALEVVERHLGPRIAGGIEAVMTTSNAYYLALVTLVARTWVQLGLALLCGFAAWVVFQRPRLRYRALAFAVAFTVTSLAQYVFGRAVVAQLLPAQADGIQTVPIQSTRNVYFLSMESLHSPAALRRLYGIHEPAYAEYLRSEGFRVLDRSYSVDSSTRASYQRMLEFGLTEMSAARLSRVLRADNSTFRSFRESGYQIQFIYVSSYFGVNPASVNHLYPERSYSVCDHLPERYFYVACRAGIRTWLSDSLHIIPPPFGPEEQLRHLLARLPGIGRGRGGPWVTFAHLAYPFHTAAGHRYDEPLQVQQFKSEYAASLTRVRDRYQAVVSSIREHDPDAVIVTFGDHGTWLTRGMSRASSNRWFSADDYRDDRYGAFLAVYPSNFCDERIQEGVSTALLSKSIIDCLNGQTIPSHDEIERSQKVFYQGRLRSVKELAEH